MAVKGKAEKARAELAKLRKAIDLVDGGIVSMLDRRAALARRTLVHKRALAAPTYQPVREAEVLRKALSRRRLFPANSLTAVYREIIGASLALEQRFSVAVFGPRATYTHIAALHHFGRNVEVIFEPTIADVFLRVEKGEVGVGVVPIENSTEGAVVSTLDSLVESPLTIAAEILLPVRHQLMVHPGTAERDGKPVVKRIASHPQPLAQCRNFLEASYPGIPLATAASTAAAAQEAVRKKGVAAIASELAAEIYGLRIIRRNIEDYAGNTTRFLLLRQESGPAPRPAAKVPYKTSIAFSMKDRPGALFAMLEPFKRHRINLAKIESRPSKVKTWRYVFFLDMEGHAGEARIRRALGELQEECQFCRVLGSYPRSPLAE